MVASKLPSAFFVTMIDAADIDADYEFLECEFNNPQFKWKGKDYVCIPSTLNYGDRPIKGGFEEQVSEFRMKVRLGQFEGVYPSLGQSIIYQGVQMQIKQIKKPKHGAFWVLVCEVPQVDV